MPNDNPIFLFAFANDSGSTLRLPEEERSARAELAAAHDQQRIEFHTLGHATLDDIYRAFNRFHNRIAVFHYGGHSDGQFLHLEDTRARAAALSTLMGMQRQLQLVWQPGAGERIVR
jgi:hypothetical protein